eukprot:1268795-Amphidinium_carterae.1
MFLLKCCIIVRLGRTVCGLGWHRNRPEVGIAFNFFPIEAFIKSHVARLPLEEWIDINSHLLARVLPMKDLGVVLKAPGDPGLIAVVDEIDRLTASSCVGAKLFQSAQDSIVSQ